MDAETRDDLDHPSAAAGERIEVRVVGHVQGVGFRWFVNRRASRLGLVGWVANDRDGSVSVVAEGPRERLDELVDALREGPPGARVERLEFGPPVPAAGSYARFEIRSGAHRGD